MFSQHCPGSVGYDLRGFHDQLKKSAPSGRNYKLSPNVPGHRFILHPAFSMKRKRDRKNIMHIKIHKFKQSYQII